MDWEAEQSRGEDGITVFSVVLAPLSGERTMMHAVYPLSCHCIFLEISHSPVSTLTLMVVDIIIVTRLSRVMLMH